MNPVLEVKDMAIGYRQKSKTFKVAENINLKLEAGKLTCLMGPNGIGKSTLIKTITGVLLPLGGNILLGNKQLEQLSQLERAQAIAVLLTEKPSAGFMTVTDLISLGRFPHTNWHNGFKEEDKTMVLNSIADVGLTNLKDSPISELSDGNMQKAIIGRALAQDTSIIVLDEPTIHLDVTNKVTIIKLLRKLSRESNKAILLSTHDLELAMTYTDRLWLFDENQIVEGLPEDLVLNGSFSKVFPTDIDGMDEPDKGLESVNFQGNAAIIALLKQAIIKHQLADKIDKNTTIQLKNSEYICKIIYKQNIYLSIEDFLDSLSEVD